MFPDTDLLSLTFGLYVRKSTESDERQVQSIEDQVEVMRDVAKQCGGLHIRKVYFEAHSAKDPYTRTDFYRMLDDLDRGYINAILCWHVDRLSRNPVDSGFVQLMLQREIIKLVKTPYRQYFPEDNAIIFAVDSAGANQQIIDHSRNVKRGLHKKADRGIWPQGGRAGYRSVEIMVENKVRHRIDVDPRRFPLLRRAWELMLTGSYTGVQVMEALNSWGYRSPKSRSGKTGGKPMGRATMYEIFKNPFFYGCFWYKGQFYRGSHKPMVSKAEFERVQEILGRENGIKPQKHEFPFTGLIRCSVCQCFATAEEHHKHYPTTGNSRTYRYYHCGNRRNCRQSVTEPYIENKIESWLESLTINREFAEWIENSLKRDLDERPTVSATLKVQREEQLKAEQKRLDALFEMRQNGEISSSEFVERKARCQSKIADLEEGLASLAKHRELFTDAVSNGLQYLTTAYQRFSQGSVREKRQVATLLAEEYTLTRGKLEIKPDPLLDALRAIEPPSEGYQQVQKPDSVPTSLTLSATTDYILTLVTEQGKTFPKLGDGLDQGSPSLSNTVGQPKRNLPRGFQNPKWRKRWKS
ncbi:MAG: hypothetical protein HONBIEJF_02547 [Fimbriimonadaceae bacterium]|nr:hypothetical protein [Fimbriimonadaceae bacterium]